MKKIFSILFVCAALSSCSSTKFVFEGNPTIPTAEGSSHFVFWGIGQEKVLNPNEICDYGISGVGTYYSFLDGLASALTFGIYQPMDYIIYCKKAPK